MNLFDIIELCGRNKSGGFLGIGWEREGVWLTENKRFYEDRCHRPYEKIVVSHSLKDALMDYIDSKLQYCRKVYAEAGTTRVRMREDEALFLEARAELDKIAEKEK